MHKSVKFLIIFFLLLVAAAAATWLFVKNSLERHPDIAEDIKIEIPKGTSVAGAIEIFNERGLLKPAWIFKNYARFYAKTNSKHIYAGFFKIEKGFTNKKIIETLFDKDNLWTVRVTFPEGLSYIKYAEAAAKKIKTDKNELLRLCRSDSLLKARGIPAKSVEGYLMPDTYEFYPEAKASEILDVMLDAHFKFIEKYRRTISESNFSHHEYVTLASIIEAETPVVEEKKTVSGLYHNRLKRNWQLQADPTVQYAIGEKRRLLYEDLKTPHPYNTYFITGLPPGPINNPGRTSILAAIYPEEHDYMYMVAVGDGSGRHNFGRDFSDHQKNIRIFRKNAR